ncbi:MAG: hypothetical protein LAT67_11260 [Balneolales bacterium]|nr:hypothetical protein [Balneolales bacterium]
MEIKESPSFFEHAAMAAFGIALITTLILNFGMIAGQNSIGLAMASLCICALIGFMPGFAAVGLHIKQTGAILELGRAAMIGFSAGFIFSIAMSGFDAIWVMLGYNWPLMLIESVENFYLDQGESISDLEEFREMIESQSGSFSLPGLILNAVLMGILSLFTGMAANGVFGRNN